MIKICGVQLCLTNAYSSESCQTQLENHLKFMSETSFLITCFEIQDCSILQLTSKVGKPLALINSAGPLGQSVQENINW